MPQVAARNARGASIALDRALVRGLAASLRGDVLLDEDTGYDGARALDRQLTEVKAAYDPHDVLRTNENVLPAAPTDDLA